MKLEEIIGTHGNDTLTGEDNVEKILAGAGDDLVFAGGGNDTVWGGRGSDLIFGEAGHDRIFGGLDSDLILGGADHDNINGGGGDDLLAGGSGHDHLNGGNGRDLIEGGSGNDVMTGGADSDTFWLTEYAGHDRITDYAAEDATIIFADSIFVGETAAGEAYLATSASQSVVFNDVSLEALEAMANITIVGFGDNSAETFTGWVGNDQFFGGGGNDTISGDDGDDYLNGGGGNDALLGGDGDDVLVAGKGNDYMVGGEGADIFVFDARTDGDSWYGGPANWNYIEDFDAGDGDQIVIRTTADMAQHFGGGSSHVNFVSGDVSFGNGTGMTYDEMVADGIVTVQIVDDFNFA